MAKENKQEISFLEVPVFRSLIRFALPVLGALILQAAYGAVDLLVVRQFGDASSISAVGTDSAFRQMVTFIITSLAMGSTVIIGQRIGYFNGCGNGIPVMVQGITSAIIA